MADDFDLSSLDTSTSAAGEMTLFHPVEETPLKGSDGKPITLQLLGIDSTEHQRAQRTITNRRLARPNRAKLTAEQLQAEMIEVLVACTVGWSDNFQLDGQAFGYSTENARTLYERFPWAREQADEFIGDRANFLRS